MIYLIHIAIILEIVLVTAIIIAIIKFDKKVNSINENIVENRYKVYEISKSIRTEINNLCNAVKCCGEKIKKKRNNFILKLVKKFILTMGIRIFFKKYRKQLIIAELIYIAYDTIQNSIKA